MVPLKTSIESKFIAHCLVINSTLLIKHYLALNLKMLTCIKYVLSKTPTMKFMSVTVCNQTWCELKMVCKLQP